MKESSNQIPFLMSGYRALDLTDEKGLLCGAMLGALGVDVIKIEKPGGDPARHIGPFYKNQPDLEKSLFWWFANTSKRGVTLDVTRPEGKAIFEKMVKTADFVIESFEPGYMSGMGLGYEALEKLNPRIILTSITPFGQTGPYASYKAEDITVWGLGGMMHTTGYPGLPPVQVTVPQAYYQGSAQGAVGSMVAHYHREITGEGQWVDVSCQEAVMMALGGADVEWEFGYPHRLRGPDRFLPKMDGIFITMHRVWECQDGYIMYNPLFAATPGKFAATSINALTREMDKAGMAGIMATFDWKTLDFATITPEFADEMQRLLAVFFRSKTKAELYEMALKNNIIVAPIQGCEDLFKDAQLRARNFFVPVAHPELGADVIYPGEPLKIKDAPWRITRRAPLIGEHNAEVFEKELGLPVKEIGKLKKSGII